MLKGGWNEQLCRFKGMQKAVVTWAIILMAPIHLLEASGVPAFTLQQGGLDYCTQEAVLSQRATGCSLINSVNLGLCSLELNFSLFCDILGEWT